MKYPIGAVIVVALLASLVGWPGILISAPLAGVYSYVILRGAAARDQAK